MSRRTSEIAESLIWITAGAVIELSEWANERYQEWKLRRRIRRFVKSGLRLSWAVAKERDNAG